MTPKVWGPPVWIFLHTFSVNISEYGYSQIGMQFYSYLTRICRQLPCPECSEHATKFISNVKPGILKNKYDMANMLCHFHNTVNARKKQPIFNNLYLAMYENISVVAAFNNFAHAFTLPTQRLMNDNLHRKMLVTQLNKFLSLNLMYFIKPRPMRPLDEPKPIEEIKNTQVKQITEILPEPEPETHIVDNIDYEVSYISETDIIPDTESQEQSELVSSSYDPDTESEEQELLSTSYD